MLALCWFDGVALTVAAAAAADDKEPGNLGWPERHFLLRSHVTQQALQSRSSIDQYSIGDCRVVSLFEAWPGMAPFPMGTVEMETSISLCSS